MKAHAMIRVYMNRVEQLSRVIAEYITPKSKDKTLVDRIKMKNGTAKFVKLTKPQKNEILDQGRKLLEGINMFLLDMNKHGKSLPERDYSRTMLLTKNFIDNMNEFESVVIKSETTKECLAKLKSKFSSINVQFDQTISYSNNSAHTADFSHHEMIQDHDTVTLVMPPTDDDIVASAPFEYPAH